MQQIGDSDLPRPGRDTIGKWVPANHACPPGNPSNSFKPSSARRLLPRQHFGPISPLVATLIDLPTSVANKRLTVWLSPLDATLTKNIEWESGTIFHVTVHSTPTPIFRTLFQVPYPATPLSATLTKTAGCHPPFLSHVGPGGTRTHLVPFVPTAIPCLLRRRSTRGNVSSRPPFGSWPHHCLIDYLHPIRHSVDAVRRFPHPYRC